jgi:hypothetical protein
LQPKKYDEAENRWQARVNQDWRFYFKLIPDGCYITAITPHPK